MSKIYLAASFSRMDEMREHRTVLEADGHTVVSRWLDETHGKHSVFWDQNDANTANACAAFAERDLADLENAEILVFFANDPLVPWVGGGRHVELGYALALNKEVYLIGEREHVFTYLPDVIKVRDLDDVRLHLGAEVEMNDWLELTHG